MRLFRGARKPQSSCCVKASKACKGLIEASKASSNGGSWGGCASVLEKYYFFPSTPPPIPLPLLPHLPPLCISLLCRHQQALGDQQALELHRWVTQVPGSCCVASNKLSKYINSLSETAVTVSAYKPTSTGGVSGILVPSPGLLLARANERPSTSCAAVDVLQRVVTTV